MEDNVALQSATTPKNVDMDELYMVWEAKHLPSLGSLERTAERTGETHEQIKERVFHRWATQKRLSGFC